MEEKPGLFKQTTETERADCGWVLRPEAPTGISIELAILSKATHPTPEMLELLQQLMVRVQESETTKEHVVRDCSLLANCSTYSSPGCSSLEGCGTFRRPQ